MLNQRVWHSQRYLLRSIPACRSFHSSQRRLLLSREFALTNQWAQHAEDLKRFQLGSSYEWIALVQKKFIGDGMASAVDVDAAMCLANEEDQVHDVVEIVYKLRHTENSADVLPSTEYAVFRFLLKYGQVDELLKVINDPINYGIFMNTHAYCLAIDYFIENDNIPGAAEIATNVMKQECFDNELLNLLSVYSLLKWLELPADQRTFSSQNVKVEEVDDELHLMEEEEITFKFPFLREEFNDGHFDLEDPMKLVTKSLKWFARHLPEAEWKSEIGELVQKLESREGEEPFVCEQKLADKVLETLKSAMSTLEPALIKEQTELFAQWRDKRRSLIETQAKHLDLQLKLDELAEAEKETRNQLELLQFFDNRVKWESEAAEKQKLFDELEIGKNVDDQEDEATYAKTMFERVRGRSIQDKPTRRNF